jgi:hypothetical protein
MYNIYILHKLRQTKEKNFSYEVISYSFTKLFIYFVLASIGTNKYFRKTIPGS